tara:strand:+ start:516 stop:3104 length:2589 start_codon:yes stop_codon:yes gene_type:complete
MTENGQCDFWAKTDEHAQPALSVRDHCINVGAVANQVAQYLSDSVKPLLPLGGVTLCALHDVGKISPGFQLKSPVWRKQWQENLHLSAPDQYEKFHATVSHHFLANLAGKPQNWLISIGGHHGTYKSNRARPRLRNVKDHPQLMSAKESLYQELTTLFGPIPEEVVEKCARLHWLTGLMIFSDWIGSNTEWFPLAETETLTLGTAKDRAHSALSTIGWHRRNVRPAKTFEAVFGFSPNPLQETLLKAADCRGLYIVEAPMGVGKTEAALALAHQRWTEGDEGGLYFALPTQLTSNRIHERITGFLDKIIEDSSTQALIHGNAKLRDDRITPLFATAPDTETKQLADEANQWFSDSRKSLLAPFGTGTIDQALMAVLPVRFAALRLFALSGKIVVIDEVHSYDPYTSALVDRAVKWLLGTGCTVVILSATLTAQRRTELVQAAGATETAPSSAYPLITKVAIGANESTSIEVPDTAPITKSIHIENTDVDNDKWIQTAITAAENGACVLIIRNTIAAAQETYKRLSADCRSGLGIQFGLIHSRFPQFQREISETLWTDQLGRSGKQRPKGAILVGTQVLEQSVDIDADLLITDSAPSDLILQRIGRLQRHNRVRPTGYEKPRCLILQTSVDWSDEPKLIRKQIGSSAFIYPPFALYQSAQVWAGITTLSLPDQIRTVLEASHQIPDYLPTGAQHFLDEFIMLTEEMKGSAWMNDVFNAPSVDDVEGSQTRWRMKPSAMVVLLRSKPIESDNSIELEFLNGEHHRFHPGYFDFKLARQLHLNAVRVPRYIVAEQLSLGIQPEWLSQHIPQSLLAIRPSDSTQCFLPNATESPAYDLYYREDLGLSHIRNEAVPFSTDMDDESWF